MGCVQGLGRYRLDERCKGVCTATGGALAAAVFFVLCCAKGMETWKPFGCTVPGFRFLHFFNFFGESRPLL